MTISKSASFLNPAKRNVLLDFWCKENLLPSDFKQWQKQTVNYASMADVEKIIFPNKSDYYEQILDKNNKEVSEQEFAIDKDHKFLRLLFFCSSHYYDIDNHQTIDNRLLFRQNLAFKDPTVKNCVVFGGDLFGTEWKMRDFNNAKFSDNADGTRNFIYTAESGDKVYYYGLNKRLVELEKDVFYALKSGAEVYLMRGAEEHEIYQATGRNILKEVYERIISKLGEKPGFAEAVNNLHYIDEGASLKINFARHKDNGEIVYGVVGLQTNNTDKAATPQGSISASQKSNGLLNCDIKFVTNSNTVGQEGNTYYVSPQAKYYRAPHKKKPVEAARDNNIFWLSMDNPHEISCRVGDRIVDPLAIIGAKENKLVHTNKALTEIAIQKITNNIQSISNGGKAYGKEKEVL